MPGDQISFPSFAANTVLEAAHGLGIDRSYLLSELGDETDELSLKYGRICGLSYNRLVRQLIGLVPGETAGLAIAEINFPRSLSPFEAGLYTSPTLRAALDLYSGYAKILANDLRAGYTLNATSITMWNNQLTSDILVRHFRNQLYFGRLALILSDLLGDRFQIQKVQFDTPNLEGSCTDYMDFFGVKPEFGQSNSCLIINKIDVDAIIPQIYPELHLLIKEDLEKRFRALNFNHHFTEKVKSVLETQQPYTTVSIDIIAKNLNLVPSTLRKKLRNENTSFSKLYNAWRAKHAGALLLDPSTSIQGVANIMGFSDISSFSRAFRNWTGTSPNQYRHTNMSTPVFSV